MDDALGREALRGLMLVANVARDIDRGIDHLFPERLGGAGEDPSRSDDPLPSLAQAPRPVVATQSGYVQAIDGDRLEIERRPGAYVDEPTILAWAWPAGRADEELAVIGGTTRRTDVRHALLEEAEVIARGAREAVPEPRDRVEIAAQFERARSALAVPPVAREQRPA